MINKNIKTIFFIVLLSTVIILSSTYSFANISNINKEKINYNSNLFKIKKVSKNILNGSLFSKNCIHLTNDNEKIISNEVYDEYNPSLAISGNNALIGYETSEENKTKVYYKTSSDSYQSWSEAIYADATFNGITYNSTFPCFTKLTTSNEYFGAFLTSDNSSYIFELSGYELNNIALWDYSNITSNGTYIGDFFDFKTPNLISYPNAVIPWVMGVIGKGEFIEGFNEFDCYNSPMFFYRDVDDSSSSRTIVFFPEVSNCSNISICLGKNNANENMIYGVCENINNSSKNLLFFHGNPDIWNSEDLLRKNILFSSENLTHPKIYAKDKNIFIVAETSSQEIIMYYSNNYGSNGSWVLKNVTHSILELDSKPVYPDIYVNESYVFCSFIESGDLMVTSSNNFGANWTTPYVINTVNGSVVERYCYKDMINNHNFVWTDNRDGNFDIYFYVDYISKVDLEFLDIDLAGDLQPFTTKNLLQITVRNNGDAIAKNIKINVSFSFKEGDDMYSDNIFEIDYIMPGGTVKISRYLFNFELSDFLFAVINFAGIDNIAVIVDPEGFTGDIDLSNNYGDIGEITYADIFPVLGDYEDMFLLFKGFF